MKKTVIAMDGSSACHDAKKERGMHSREGRPGTAGQQSVRHGSAELDTRKLQVRHVVSSSPPSQPPT